MCEMPLTPFAKKNADFAAAFGRRIGSRRIPDRPADAARLELSEYTIKSHRKRLSAKLDITTERALFAMFVEHHTHYAR